MTRGLLKHRAPGKAKKANRLKRAKRARMKIRELNTLRLTVHRTPQHIYAQVIGAESGSDRILVQASTLDKSLKAGNGGNVEAATAVGALVAERATAAGVRKVAFDRSGYKYHGRVKALADAARAGGLEF
ncbi:MAG: 50S ribosomal protein L18 [Gammaproteobacteria bacterium]|nr:50S ribosomal protein L18 [Gammaproteobacteria bacterium]